VKVYYQCTSKCLVAPYIGQKFPKAVTNLGLGIPSLYKNVLSMCVISGLHGDNTDNISVSLKNRTPPALITADPIISHYQCDITILFLEHLLCLPPPVLWHLPLEHNLIKDINPLPTSCIS